MSKLKFGCQRCGQRLYDDFQELFPNAVQDLEQRLNLSSNSSPQDRNGHNANRPGFINSVADSLLGLLSYFRKSQRGGSRPPSLHMYETNDSSQGPTNPASTNLEDLFLLLCIPHRKYATKLVQMNVCKLQSDREFFTNLKTQYQKMRGHFISVLSLRKLTLIQFVKFELYKNELVDIRKTNDIPPKDMNRYYSYNPKPPNFLPPVGENHMMHLYECPEDADEMNVCLDRIPKKIHERLTVCSRRHTGLGWGVHLAEGFDWHKFWIFAFVGYTICITFGVCWSKLKHDVQGGFGVSACLMFGLTFATGIVQTALDPKYTTRG